MKLSEIVGAEVAAQPAGDIEITGLTADSREVKPGYLFAALPGTRVDGAKYIPQALQQGAAAILVSQTSASAGAVAGVPVIRDPEPRRRLALMAARFYVRQPEVVVAVTGTNGKTSVASFLRQIWQALHIPAASIGTLGIAAPGGTTPLHHTTPDPVELHRVLADLDSQGVSHVVLEASSHGLTQHRIDGVSLSAGAFTNISRDHLDYHPDFESYLKAKLRLFTEVLRPGTAAVVNVDHAEGERVADAASARGLDLWTVGRCGVRLRLSDVRAQDFAQQLELVYEGRPYSVRLPLIGAFQAENACVAAALALASGCKPDDVFAALGTLEGARGRLEYVGKTASGGAVFVDYAHTPDALANALLAIRPFASGAVAVVFGCGGDRDRGKRPEMGAVAQQLADRIYVTDDNPRGEDPAMIRQEILTAVSGAREIAGRGEAIRHAIQDLGQGDILLVAGKGHECGQIIGDRVIPFSDHEAVQAVLRAMTEQDKSTEGVASAQTDAGL